jgi:hypothetical protein
MFLIRIALAFLFMVAYAAPVTIRSALQARRHAEQHEDLITSP